ncbi:tRNA-splicing endonuclease subunit [Nesidiocoris tenuis]|uniref:tRNA-splicing endonuclease subunit Sen34 n=1 Tax=Nesidiocoris tenuis TaxID=355587 RepID=A0ABN7AJP1_9HEMI|nr:tRNA-splicing endonuclease subunit [Nesidiocoris tenuis]
MNEADPPILITLDDQKGFIWDADDWLKLRKEHRIVGNLIGSLANIPRQDVVRGMPMVLLPEEVTLLLEKNIAVLMKVSDETEPDAKKEEYKQYLEKVQKEQLGVYERKRMLEVKGLIDRIVEGKKRKMARGEAIAPVDEESIYEAEMARMKKLEGGVFVQIPTANPWLKETMLCQGEWPYPKTAFETLKYRVFKDLWEKGLYLTNGSKFGGHFLAYPGDPLKFHAFYVVVVHLPENSISPLDLVRHARLGTHTKKTFVIASTNSENRIIYSSFEWTGKT